MRKFKLDLEFKNQFQSFLSSNLFFNQKEYSKSEYWKFHSNEIKYFFKNSTLFVDGKSGFYVPEESNLVRGILKIIKKYIKNQLNFNQNNYMSYKKAFNIITNEQRQAGFQQVNFNKKKILTKNFSECKKIFPFKKYEINEHMIRSYYFINLLSSYIDLSKINYALEIGAGNGNLISLLKSHFKFKCIINVDLPETLILSIAFLKNLFPNSKILFPHQISKKIDEAILSEYDFIFLTPNQIDLLNSKTIDLSINTNSFAEMNIEQIKEYLEFIDRIGKDNSFFFTSNAVEKIPVADNKENSSNKIKPTRFFEYPFFKNDILFFGLCRFRALIQQNPVFVRLEKKI